MPEWVHLVPFGKLNTRDKRRFVNDAPQTVLATFEMDGIDLPIDYQHQNDVPATQNGPVPAAGWIKELVRRADGRWGRVEWTERARELIAKREYRYLSPSLLVDKKTRRVLRLKGAGLVHNPDLHLTALNSQKNDMSEDLTLTQRLLALLDLPDEADEDAIIAAPDAYRQTLDCRQSCRAWHVDKSHCPPPACINRVGTWPVACRRRTRRRRQAGMSRVPDHLENLRQSLAQARALNHAEGEVLDTAFTHLKSAIERVVQHPIERLDQTTSANDHRRLHRLGRPPRIDIDPELRVFILARIESQTFDELADAVADAFPKSRRIGKSANHAWWTRSQKPKSLPD